jgi:hypothetical protein
MKSKLRSIERLAPGDIVGFSGYSPQSYFINAVTYGLPRWGISHVGIVGEYDGRLLLFESTTGSTLPCYVLNRKIAGTQCHDPSARLHEYRGKAWHYPLRQPLRPWERKALTRYLTGSLGRPYDALGAFHSGASLFAYFMAKVHDENTAALFCSEWCVAALRFIERFDTDHVGRWSPNAFIRECRRRAILISPRRIL